MANAEESKLSIEGQNNVIPFRTAAIVNPVKPSSEAPSATASEALALKKAQADMRDALKQLMQMGLEIRSLQQQVNWYQEHSKALQQENAALTAENQQLTQELGVVKARINHGEPGIKVSKSGFFAAKSPALPLSANSEEVYPKPLDSQGKP